MDLDSAVSELYGLVPEEFMDARKRLGLGAKSGGDAGLAKAIDSVRKPTAAAWALNQLVRRRPDEVERLLALAASLQDASERMDGAAMRDLGRERTRLIDELVRATSDVASEAGGALSMPVADQVRQTFVAALASPPAAEAVASGRLTRALTYAGFGDVDLSEATAAPSPARRPALRVITGEGRGSNAQDDESEDETPEEVGAAEVEAEVDDEPEGPDPVLLERLAAAETRTRQTTAEAASAGAALTAATDSLAAVDLRITELDAALKAARAERDDLVGRRAEAAAADKVAQRTLRASFAELDAVQALLPEEDDEDDA
ncbi:hypothetical protein [Lapillicoccus sp.]|uniref:hypothetical protein n=1 Tax=Lapillicoccus sp. TaxID=1909287 RepID=UPI0025E18205|nr:hypothetical protein [Lapillicoccus sp.]